MVGRGTPLPRDPIRRRKKPPAPDVDVRCGCRRGSSSSATDYFVAIRQRDNVIRREMRWSKMVLQHGALKYSVKAVISGYFKASKAARRTSRRRGRTNKGRPMKRKARTATAQFGGASGFEGFFGQCRSRPRISRPWGKLTLSAQADRAAELLAGVHAPFLFIATSPAASSVPDRHPLHRQFTQQSPTGAC